MPTWNPTMHTSMLQDQAMQEYPITVGKKENMGNGIGANTVSKKLI